MELHSSVAQCAVMRTYHCHAKFTLLAHFMILLAINYDTEYVLCLNLALSQTSKILTEIKPLDFKRITVNNINSMINQSFTMRLLSCLAVVTTVTWLFCLLVLAGDVHPHPGPTTSSSVSSISSSSSGSFSCQLNAFHHLSFVHYNVQSILNKMDTLAVEFSEFDILAFSETWLRQSILTDELLIPSYYKPERKDRVRDPHGGVLIYVKDNLAFQRRNDLELPGIESIWIEIILKHKHVLFGVFYRPPDSDHIYHSVIEDSINLAIDTGILDVVITGDFNYNMLNDNSKRKISSMCQQFSLQQCITPVLRIDNQQNFKIMKILILLKSFISLFYIIRYILQSMM